MTVLPEVALSKKCFVTIGATAAFDSLIRAILREDFLQALQRQGYSDLEVQYGEDVSGVFKDQRDSASKIAFLRNINITGFAFNKKGLGQEMRAAKGGSGSNEGVVISHAGSGSILDALRISVPIIVVPNPQLLDNHQLELAEQLAQQGYVVHGNLEQLPAALEEVESLRQSHSDWPPRNQKEDPTGRGLIGVMDDEMGFVD